MSFWKLFLAATLSLNLGCITHRVPNKLPNLVIATACLKKPITLLRCDLSKDPPSCKSAIISYIRGCEQVAIGKNTEVR